MGKTHVKATHTITNQLKKKKTTQDLMWFGRQLQPTSTRATIRFSLCLVAPQLQVQ